MLALVIMILVVPFCMDATFAQDLPWKPVLQQNSYVAGEIYDIAQDDTGYIWLGTSQGLLYHDSTETYAFPRADAQSSSSTQWKSVRDVECDADNLWLATDAGVFRGTNGGRDFERLDASKCRSIQASKRGVFALTDSGRLLHLQPDSDQFAEVALSGDSTISSVNAFDIDSLGQVWAATSLGLLRITATGQIIQEHWGVSGLSKDVTTIFIDSRDDIWIGQRQRVVLKRAFTNETVVFPRVEYRPNQNDRDETTPAQSDVTQVPNDPNSKKIVSRLWQPNAKDWLGIVEDRRGNVWLSDGRQVQVYRVDEERLAEPTEFASSDEDVDAISPVSRLFCDAAGTMWIGTASRGVWRQHVRTQSWSKFQRTDDPDTNTLPGGPIMSVYRDHDGRVWMGTAEGLFVSDAGELSFREVPLNSMEIPSNRGVHAFAGMPDGSTLVGTTSGLEVVSRDLEQVDWLWKSYQNGGEMTSQMVISIQPSENEILVGTYTGLMRYDGNDWSSIGEASLDNAPIYNMQMLGGQLLVAAGNGLYVRSAGEIAKVRFAGDSSDLACNDILLDRQGNVWLATPGGLFRRTAGSSEFVSVDRAVSAERVEVLSLCEAPDGTIIAADVAGLTAVEDFRSRDLNALLGITAESLQAPKLVVMDRERMLAASMWQLDVIPFAATRQRSHDPAVVVSGVRPIDSGGNTDAPFTSIGPASQSESTGQLLPASFDYDTVAVSFKLAMLDYGAPERHRFEYRTDAHSQWQAAGGDTITISGLDMGEHSVQVRGWSPITGMSTPRNFDFVIPTPFWRTTLFQVSMVCGLLVLGAALVSVQLARVRQRNAVLKQMSASFEQKATELQAVLNSIAEGVLVTGPDGRMIDCNPIALKILGLEREKLLGRLKEQLFVRIDPPAALRGREGSYAQLVQELRPQGQSNEPVFELSESTLDVTAAGTKQEVLVFRDVSKELLVQEQLRQAEKMDSLGLLAGGMAHDLNNLLFSAYMHSELTVEQLSSRGEETDHAARIGPLLDQASELTRQLLTFSRKTETEFRPVSISSLIDDTVAALKVTLPSGIRLVCDTGKLDVFVNGDRLQLLNMLLNIGFNARDAIETEGQITIVARTHGAAEQTAVAHPPGRAKVACEGGRAVVISVADTGVGMSPEVRERIFEPYFTTKDNDKGTGLGLATSFGTVQAHGGYIEVHSSVGAGSTFDIYLPLLESPTVDMGATGEILQGSGTVMVVDDDARLLVTLEKVLQGLGYDVIACADGDEAIERLRESAGLVQVVLLDMMMPGMSGREVMQALQAIDPNLEFIIASSFELSHSKAELLKGGARTVIQKPISISKLSEHLSRAGSPRNA